MPLGFWQGATENHEICEELLSDMEMEQACMYDIQIKYALGLALDERPFDHSSLGDFRKRLLENGKEKEIFDRILSHLIKQGLIEKNEIQRIDATHVIADIAIPTMVQFVRNPWARLVYPKSMFKFDEKKRTLITIYHFPLSKCGKCPVRSKCTNSADGRRTVGISAVNAEIAEPEFGFTIDVSLDSNCGLFRRYHSN
jgi:hypothetical protein